MISFSKARGRASFRTFNLPALVISLTILLSAAASCAAEGNGEPHDQLSGSELRAVITAITDSLGPLAIDTVALGYFNRSQESAHSETVPLWFVEQVKITVDSMGLSTWTMEEAGICATAFGLALPPESPPGGDPKLQAECNEKPAGSFSLHFPKRLSGDQCEEESICWEVNITAWRTRSETGMPETSLIELRALIVRSLKGGPPFVSLEVTDWMVS